MNPFHSPEELRQLSTQVHWVIGYILLGALVAALLQQSGLVKSKLVGYMWPGLVTLAGVFLVPFLLLHHGVDQLGLTWRSYQSDPQQMQHLTMGVLLLIAGTSELLRQTSRVAKKWLWLVWPAVLMIIGVMFITHPQHGTAEAMRESMRFHGTLGIILVLAGGLKGWAELVQSQKWLAYAWLVPLFVASIMFVTYKEPEGAYSAPANGTIMNNQHHE